VPGFLSDNLAERCRRWEALLSMGRACELRNVPGESAADKSACAGPALRAWLSGRLDAC
jgi:hypothetical protein